MPHLSTFLAPQRSANQLAGVLVEDTTFQTPPQPQIFEAASLEGIEVVMGAVRLNLMDAHGLTRHLDLQPFAEAQVSTALLTGRTDATGQFHERGPVMADDICIATFIPPPIMQPSMDPTAMMEIRLTDKATLQVALPRRLEEKLLECLLRRRELSLQSAPA